MYEYYVCANFTSKTITYFDSTPSRKSIPRQNMGTETAGQGQGRANGDGNKDVLRLYVECH